MRTARVLSPGRNRLEEMGTAGGKWDFPQAAGGSRGQSWVQVFRLRASVQQGTPYHGVLALGKVNEIRLLPPILLLLPLVEAICQDHAALALEESTLGRDSTSEWRTAASGSLQWQKGSCNHPASHSLPGLS